MVPWRVPYDHRFTIYPLRIQKDLYNSMYDPQGYLKWLEKNGVGRKHFVKTILRFFPS